MAAWKEFHRHFPIDDFHRIYRPTALLAAIHTDGNARKHLDWLCPEPVIPGYTEADMSTFRAFGIKPPVKD